MIYTFDGIKNVRELGDIETLSGKHVKKDLLFRTGELTKASERDIDLIKNKYKVKAFIDFRDKSECKIRKDIKVEGISYYSFPALPPLNMPEDPVERKKFIDDWNKRPKEVFLNLYKNLAISIEAKEAYRNFFKVLLSLDGQAVLWHCTQGKDRTGIASILLLTVLGVSQEDAINEYFLTNKFMEKEYKKLKENDVSEEQLKIMKIVLFVRQECIDLYLAEIDKLYGSLENYIINELGITREEIIKLRQYYLK